MLGPDPRCDVARDAERADDPAPLVAKRHLRGRHPGVRPAAVGLQLNLPYDGLARTNNLLLVPEGNGGVLVAEDIEVRLPDQLPGGAARGVRGDPACADQEEPALQVLEIHPLFCSGEQVAHAGELKLALRLALFALFAPV